MRKFAFRKNNEKTVSLHQTDIAMANIRLDQQLKAFNTFGISARAAGYAEFRNRNDLDAVFADPAWHDRPWRVLGGGSNVLLTGDYDGLILHAAGRQIAELRRDDHTVVLQAQAGVEWDDFVRYCVGHGYGGVENLSGIPGTVGASPVQNIGAYGAEVKDTIVEVEAYLPESGTIRSFTRDECRFGYRDSIFKGAWKGRAIVLSVTFELSLHPEFRIGYGDLAREVEALGGASPEHIRRAVLSIREAKLPDPAVLGNSGSFFKNPVVPPAEAAMLKEAHPDLPTYPAPNGVKLAAGWLIDRAGLKGFRQGNAGVHARQALVLVNYGGATGRDILALADHVVATVASHFGVRLEMEVNVW
jgi:UDP-N-acetylmuramate dehydrogenase